MGDRITLNTNVLNGICPNGCPDLDVEPQYTVGKKDVRLSHYEIYCDNCGYNGILRRGTLTDLNNPENDYREYYDYEYKWGE